MAIGIFTGKCFHLSLFMFFSLNPILVHSKLYTCRCSVYTVRSMFSLDSGIRLADDQLSVCVYGEGNVIDESGVLCV